jgi:RNA polymerase sigma factor (TIGR02999 family)
VQLAGAEDFTELLRGWSGGDSDSLAAVVKLAYTELKRIALRCLSKEQPGSSIRASDLVHEAYLQLVKVEGMPWRDRVHFFAIAAKVMRRILVDHARVRGAAKRGAGVRRVDFDPALVISAELDPRIVELDDALARLEGFDPRKAQVVEIRYFGGMTTEETAEALGISPQSVSRDPGEGMAAPEDEQAGESGNAQGQSVIVSILTRRS